MIIGSPTHGGVLAEGIHDLLKVSLTLDGVNVTAFDTRMKRTIFGYAVPKIVQSLEKNFGNLLVPPLGFVVLGIKDPLKDGESEQN